MAKLGPNVSPAQGTIDWSQVVGNVDFVLIRAGFDDSSYPNSAYFDSQWVNNYTGAVQYNIPYGVWWFCYALNTTQARESGEAVGQYLLDHSLTPTYPIYYDIEGASITAWQNAGITVTSSFVLSIINAWCSGVESKGFLPGVYFNASMYSTYNYANLFTAHPTWSKWLAQWGSTRPTWIDWDFWQYSSGDHDQNIIPGINGSVDMNYLKDGYNPPTPPTPTLKKLPIWMYLKFPF